VFGRHATLSPDGRQTYIDEGQLIATYDHQPAEAVRLILPPDSGDGGPTLAADVAAAGPVIGLKMDGIVIRGAGRADRITVPRGLFQTPETELAIAPTGAAAVTYHFNPFGSTVTVYDVAARRITGSITLRDPERGVVRLARKFAVAPDGHTLAVQTEHGLFLADLTATKVIRVVREALRYGLGVTFTPDSRAVLVGGGAATRELVLLSLADGRVLARMITPAREELVGISPDGTLLATTAERRLVLRDAATLAPAANGEIPATVNDLGAGAFAPDGCLIATCGPDGKVRLWDVQRREELIALDLGAGAIRKVVFTPDGAKLRFIAGQQVGELDLHAFDAYVESNLTWNLLRLLPELDRAEAERVLNRLRDTHPEAYRAGAAALPPTAPAK
jgi:hypothetical protein